MHAPRKSRSTVIVFLLVATLAMTAALAYEAQQAARSHRAAAENVLRDYAKFAAFELSRVGRTQLLTAILQELEGVRGPVKHDGHVHKATCANCGAANQVRSTFRAALPDAQFTFAGEQPAPVVRDILQRAAADGMRSPDDFTCPALHIVQVNGAPLAVVWRPQTDDRNKPIAMFGYTVDARFVAVLFERILKQDPLLPPSLVPASSKPNTMLAVRVATPEGVELFSSAKEWSPYAASHALGKDLSALNLSVALRPDTAGSLIIGGLPRERLPLVIGLLALTASLVVVALVQLRREAELSRLRSDFVSGVSHELRTPLAQIRMFTETLLLGRVRSEVEGRRSLEIIARETQRLAQLVENVLLFSRGERRQPQISRETARLAPIVTEVVESFTPLAAARQARVTMQLDHGVCANVDPGAIRQILLNLMDNAVKYGPSGQTVRVALSMEAGTVRLAVEDEGPGIDTADATRIFEPFNRLSRPGDATGGTGIGLAIVQQLAMLHQGRAWVEAGANGARFVVEIDGAWIDAAAAPAVA